MPKITIIYSLLLILLGLFGYFVWGGQQSLTALIPSYAGLLFLMIGLIALKEKARKHAMHVAAALSLLLFFATARSVVGFITLIQGGEVLRPLAVKVQFSTALLSLVFILLCVRSFINARKAMKSTSN